MIYYLLSEDEQVWLLTLYDKDEATDLAPDEKALLKAMVDKETKARRELRERRKKRS